MMDSRRVLNCFDRLEVLVGNRTPVHGSEAPFLVNVLESIREEKRIASELLDRGVLADVPVPTVREIERIRNRVDLGGGCRHGLGGRMGPLCTEDLSTLLDTLDERNVARGGHCDPIGED